MNLYREVNLEEMEKQIVKAKDKVAVFMETRSEAVEFVSEFDKGNFKDAIKIAREDMAFGYGTIIGELVQYCRAKTILEKGEKIFTTMLITGQSK